MILPALALRRVVMTMLCAAVFVETTVAQDLPAGTWLDRVPAGLIGTPAMATGDPGPVQVAHYVGGDLSSVELAGADCSDPVECAGGGFFAGAEYLFIRPHFSEAIAFVRGTQTPTSYTAVTEALDFNYDSSLRLVLGYQASPGEGELRFTYWHLDADTAVAANNPGAGQFIVDPFGNLVGAAAVIDPRDNRFGQVLIGGERIATRASVDMNVFDLDFGTSACLQNQNWALDWAVGVRVARVDQFYDSLIFDAGNALVSRGDFTVDFTGAGPRLGAGLSRVFGGQDQYSIFVKGAGSVILGDYVVASSFSPNGVFVASQRETMTRLIPILEAEVGGTWQMNDRLTLTSGWTFQSWFDFGTSGGNFGGFFGGADDANIMSFDGFFARGEVAF